MDYRERIATVEGWFVNHHPYRISDGLLCWRQHDRSAYSLRFVTSANYLFVGGDLEAAAYCLTETARFEKIATYGLEYFAGKCEASRSGRGGREWCEEKARQYLNHVLESEPTLRDQVAAECQRSDIPGVTEIDDLCEHRETFGFLQMWFPDHFDSPDAGMVISNITIAHWRGLQMAVAALGAIKAGGAT